MSKNITILEGKRARILSQVKKLRTNLVGGGTQDWVPEDEVDEYCDLQTLNVTANGTYTPQDIDGYNKVIVNVTDGANDFIKKTIKKNGTYIPADDGAAGYSSVEVDVKGVQSAGDYTFQFEGNDASVVNCTSLQVVGSDVFAIINYKLYKQTNGQGAFVDTGVGVSNSYASLAMMGDELYLLAFRGPYMTTPMKLCKWNGSDFVDIVSFPNDDQPRAMFQAGAFNVLNDTFYILGGHASTTYDYNIYRYNGSEWEETGIQMPNISGYGSLTSVVYNGKIHFFYPQATNNHYAFDGSSIEAMPDMPDVNGYMATSIPAVFKINDIERIHVCYWNSYLHYSFNGEFWRPEENMYSNGGSILWAVNDKFYTTSNELKLVTAEDEEDE